MAITKLAARSMSLSDIKDVVVRVCEHEGVELKGINYSETDMLMDVLIGDCDFDKQCCISCMITDILIGFRDKETLELDEEISLEIDDVFCPSVTTYDDKESYDRRLRYKYGVDLDV